MGRWVGGQVGRWVGGGSTASTASTEEALPNERVRRREGCVRLAARVAVSVSIDSVGSFVGSILPPPRSALEEPGPCDDSRRLLAGVAEGAAAVAPPVGFGVGSESGSRLGLGPPVGFGVGSESGSRLGLRGWRRARRRWRPLSVPRCPVDRARWGLWTEQGQGSSSGSGSGWGEGEKAGAPTTPCRCTNAQ